MRQKFKFDSTEDAVKRLKNQFKDFNLESHPIFMEINSKRVVGNQYNEVAIFLSKSSEESFLYIYIKLNFPLLRYQANLFPLLSKRREDNPSWSRLPSRERGR